MAILGIRADGISGYLSGYTCTNVYGLHNPIWTLAEGNMLEMQDSGKLPEAIKDGIKGHPRWPSGVAQSLAYDESLSNRKCLCLSLEWQWYGHVGFKSLNSPLNIQKRYSKKHNKRIDMLMPDIIKNYN
ncbi:Diaminopimelate decarboxylase [Trichinella pseudospiralis]